jgi:hypothetical protein
MMYSLSTVVLVSKINESYRGRCSFMNIIAVSVKCRAVVMIDGSNHDYENDVAADWKSAS